MAEKQSINRSKKQLAVPFTNNHAFYLTFEDKSVLQKKNQREHYDLKCQTLTYLT